MSRTIPEQQFKDRFSRQDELLAMMIPILRDIRDKTSPVASVTPSANLTELVELLTAQNAIYYEPFTLTYPFDGTRLTIAAGTTLFDFAAGTVKAPGAAVAEMTTSLSKHRKEFMRALTFNADAEVILQIESEDKLLCRAGNWPIFPSKEFTKVRVTVTESTEIVMIASTSPAAITQMLGETSPNTHEFTGDVYEGEHTMTALDAGDISTAVYLQNFSVATQETDPTGVFFSPTGLKMYVLGTGGDDVNEYDLGTAWDVSSAVYLQNFDVSAQEGMPHGLFFNHDGTKMYITGGMEDDVNEYNLRPYRFETADLLLRDVIIRISTHGAQIGDSSHQRYPISVGSSCGFTRVNLAELYFKNADPSNNTKINILGVRL